MNGLEAGKIYHITPRGKNEGDLWALIWMVAVKSSSVEVLFLAAHGDVNPYTAEIGSEEVKNLEFQERSIEDLLLYIACKARSPLLDSMIRGGRLCSTD